MSTTHSTFIDISNSDDRWVVTNNNSTTTISIDWSVNKLEEELYLHLMKVKEEQDSYVKRKYEEQAKNLIYRIPVYRQTPYFTINTQDLNDKLRSELETLDQEPLNNVMKGAIGRIFESINLNYYLLSVKRLLKWRFAE